LLTAAYELVGRKEDAVSAYMKAGMWRECLNVGYSIPMAPPDITQLAVRLAESLVEHRQFIDAARLYIDYGTDGTAVESAVKALAKGYHFTEAMRVVMLSLVETDSG
jgi:elongator complex protein 1